ncbi:MAG: response regulator [SAR324 cluster bacterium]|uniref:histidine kinase n=1 Tax=SAR324 cluster bacterium TaxID=2024889 RepID=A0A7X9FQR7_9DELT|nr:response regulator [SAR324 cluster bacterium]
MARTHFNEGFQAFRYLQALGQKIRLILHSSEENYKKLDSTEVFPELHTNNSGLTDESLLIYRRISDFARRKFSANASCILLPDSYRENLTIVADSSDRTQKIQNFLRNIVEENQSASIQPDFSIRSLEKDNLDSSYLYELGFRYAATVPFFNNSQGKPAILWLGFAHRPDPETLSGLKSLSSILTHELPKLKHIYENSSNLLTETLAHGMKAQSLAYMSHDMKSPLNNIRAIFNLLRVEAKDSDKIEILEVGLNNCEIASELVNSILDISAYQAGKLVARPEILRLEAIVDETVQIFSVAARLKGLELSWNSAAQEAVAFADRGQVKRVLSNLISNAIKYTKYGSVNISIEAPSHGFIFVTVKDTGCGINEAQINKLFTPFTRLNDFECEGLGIGLTLSKILIQLNNGNITVKSEVGKGSSFTLSLPAFHKEESKPLKKFGSKFGGKNKAMPLEESPKHVSNASLKILLVDDDPECVESLSRNLENPNCTVLKAHSVQEALYLINFDCPDVLITDEKMPEGGGIQLIKELKSLNVDIPTALITGNQRRLGNARGEPLFDHTFSKPVDLSELKNWLGEISHLPR